MNDLTNLLLSLRKQLLEVQQQLDRQTKPNQVYAYWLGRKDTLLLVLNQLNPGT